MMLFATAFGSASLVYRALLPPLPVQRRTERKSTRMVIRRLFKELPAKVEALWSDGLRRCHFHQSPGSAEWNWLKILA